MSTNLQLFEKMQYLLTDLQNRIFVLTSEALGHIKFCPRLPADSVLDSYGELLLVIGSCLYVLSDP